MSRWTKTQWVALSHKAIAMAIVFGSLVAVWFAINLCGSWLADLPYVGWPHAAFLAYLAWGPVLTGMQEVIRHLVALTGGE